MRKLTIIGFAALLSACSMGYWPKVEGDTGSKYQADVRDCQTSSHEFGAGDLLAGGVLGAALAGQQSQSGPERAAIDACMAQRGYRVSKTE